VTASPIFTIGYEGANVASVLDALKSVGVQRLLDIRALPLSRKPGFSKRQLAAGTEASGLGYLHLRALGTPKPGRDAARAGRTTEMEAIYSRHLATDEAQHELAAAVSLARRFAICLLCFERDAHRCHRRLVAEALAQRTGQAVVNLMPD
jgi:uncharacterized protein (DUF488 family)